MTNLTDPLERLRAANPVPTRAVATIAPDPVLFARITTPAPAPAPAPRRWRDRRLMPVLLAGSVLTGAVAATFYFRDHVTKPETVACFEAAAPDAPAQVTGVDRRGPVAACADLWRQGLIGAGGDAPPLVECVLPSGIAGVFPTRAGEDTCARLSLPAPSSTPSTTVPPPPAPTAADVNARILAFRDAVLPQFLDAPCVELAPATTIVRRELDRAGLGDWTVRAGEGFSAARPCVTLSLRPEAREVILVPTPRR